MQVTPIAAGMVSPMVSLCRMSKASSVISCARLYSAQCWKTRPWCSPPQGMKQQARVHHSISACPLSVYISTGKAAQHASTAARTHDALEARPWKDAGEALSAHPLLPCSSAPACLTSARTPYTCSAGQVYRHPLSLPDRHTLAHCGQAPRVWPCPPSQISCGRTLHCRSW